MINPKILLRLMLLSLGAAAVVGAAGVLMGGSEVIAKTIGTLVLLAVCTGLLIWVTRGLADPKSRPSAVLAAGLITAEFLLILGLIWDVEKLIGGRNEWLFQFVFILAGTGLPACFALRFIQHPQGKIASIAGLVLCGVVFGFWVLDLEYDVWRWWESANTLYGIGALVVLCLVGVGTDRRHWRWLGVAAAVAAYAAVAWHLAFDTETGNQTAVTALICAAGVIAHANVALRCPLKPGQKWIARGSVAAMAATAVFLTLMVWDNGRDGGSSGAEPTVYERLASACGIIAACMTLALAVVWRINQKMAFAPPKSGEALNVAAMQVAVVCPMCQRKFSLGKDGAACPGCGLRMKITLEEPRCESCGYSLLMLSGGRCPECGATAASTPIAAT